MARETELPKLLIGTRNARRYACPVQEEEGGRGFSSFDLSRNATWQEAHRARNGGHAFHFRAREAITQATRTVRGKLIGRVTRPRSRGR